MPRWCRVMLALLVGVLPLVTDPAGADVPGVGRVPRDSSPASVAGREIETQRTARSKTFETATRGAYRTTYFANDVHVRDGTGAWHDIDLGLRPGPGDRLSVGRSGVATDFGADSGGDIARVDLGTGVLVRIGAHNGRRVKAEVSGAAVRYPGVFDGGGLEVHAVPSGMKDVIVLPDREAAQQSRFEFDLSVGSGSASEDAAGAIEIRGSSGIVVGQIPRGWMEDSSLDATSNVGAVSEAVDYELAPSGPGRYLLTVVVDTAWLEEPGRVFPVRVDPSVMRLGGQRDDTYVLYGGRQSNHTSTELRTGTAFVNFRSFAHFGPFESLNDASKTISRARISLYQTFARTCTDSPAGAAYLNLYKLTSPWGDETSPATNITTWNSQPVAQTPPVASVSATNGCASTPGGWVTFDSDASGMSAVKDLVTGWIADPGSNHGISLRTAVEGASYSAGYKVFASSDHSSAGTFGSLVPRVDVLWSWVSGDGVTDVASFRPGNGHWYSEDGSDAIDTTYAGVAWGTSGDVPVYGDYDGDDRPEPAVYRPATTAGMPKAPRRCASTSTSG